MLIKNISKKTTISKNARVCKGILSKSIGLMFLLRPKTLIFIFKKEKIIPLHMLFVFFPIDVLFLDKNKIVIEKKEKFLPFTFFTPKKKVMYVVELPHGKIKKSKTNVNDKIEF